MAPRPNPSGDWAIIEKFSRSARELFTLIKVILVLSISKLIDVPNQIDMNPSKMSRK